MNFFGCFQNIDIIADGVAIETNENMQSDFTDSFFFQYTGMMIRSPNHYNTWLIVTEPFSWQIWLLIFLFVIISGIWFKFATFTLSKFHKDQTYNYLNSGWAFFSISVQQGINRQPKSSAARIVIGLWWLASITVNLLIIVPNNHVFQLSASFTGSLVALFSVERDSLPFKSRCYDFKMFYCYDCVTALQSMVDVVKTGKYTILMSKNDKWQADLISVSFLSTKFTEKHF